MSSNEFFGLTDSDVRVALCALKVMLADDNGKVEKGDLARLTGHKVPDSALRVWYVARAKLMKCDSPSGSATPLVSADTPTKGPKKTGGKMRTPNSKKRVKEQSADEDAGEEEVEKRANKRVKKEAGAAEEEV